MEWLMCLLPQYKPSSFIEEFKTCTYLSIENLDPLVYSFLEDYVDTLSDLTWFNDSMHAFYCPPSSAGFCKKLLKKYPWEYESMIRFEHVNPKLHYNLQYIDPTHWKPNLEDMDLENPINMHKYLKSGKHDKDNILIELLSAKGYYMPYADIFLKGLTNENLLKVLKSNISKPNLYSIIKYVKEWEPKSLRLQSERTNFISSLSPLTIQIIFVDNKKCWYDAKEDACQECTCVDWNSYLPQYRCQAQCFDNAKICNRFAVLNEDFCLFHKRQPKSKFRKRQYDKPVKYQDATKKDYDTNPFTNEIQPVRFRLTDRPVNAMTKLLPVYKRSRKAPSGYYLPIIRYENLYYSKHGDSDEKKAQFCGKFFYFEPESNIYLHLGNSCFFASKVDAYMNLSYLAGLYESVDHFVSQYPLFSTNGNNIGDLPSSPGKILKRIMSDMPLIRESIVQCPRKANEGFFLDPFLTYRYRTIFLSAQDFDSSWHTRCLPVFYPTETLFSDLPDSVGEFDFLDQKICNLAKALGFDSIVLQHEVGGHDSVTEIIHTRQNFEDSLYEFNNLETDLEPQTIYPKIWLPTENGILVIDAKLQRKIISVNNHNINDIFTNYGRNLFAKTGLKTLPEKAEWGISSKPRPFPVLSHPSDSEYESDLDPDNFG